MDFGSGKFIAVKFEDCSDRHRTVELRQQAKGLYMIFNQGALEKTISLNDKQIEQLIEFMQELRTDKIW